MKGTLVYSMRAKTRWQSVTLLNLSWEHACQDNSNSFSLRVTTNDCRSVASIDLGLQMNFRQVGKLVNTEFANNEDQIYTFYVIVCYLDL